MEQTAGDGHRRPKAQRCRPEQDPKCAPETPRFQQDTNDSLTRAGFAANRQQGQRFSADHDACGVGFIAQLGVESSRDVVERALLALQRLNHRGGVDADGCSGDGAGLLTAIPRDFFRRVAADAGIELPEQFAVGMVLLPPQLRSQAEQAVETAIRSQGLKFLGWREVAAEPRHLGPRSTMTLPAIAQCFVAMPESGDGQRRLFLARKRIETTAPAGTYVCSLSERTIVYKGLLVPWQLPAFYRDLADAEFVSSFAIFHQRYSTNTSPTWRLAQPFRGVAHNGEINTISSNRRWMQVRERALRREFGAGLWYRALESEASDSASFDNAFETLLQQGHSPAAAMYRLSPPAWEHDSGLPASLRSYLQQAAAEQEPWDGPAALIFTDGRYVGARLDRNGLRPMRYTLTASGLVVVGSEVGIADLTSQRVTVRGRLGPGEMVMVDSASGDFFGPHDVATLVAPETQRTFVALARLNGAWRAPQAVAKAPNGAAKGIDKVAAAVGFTQDQFKLLFKPLVESGKESTFSMGDDAPPAFLSEHRRLIWDYCKQRFAQVTNPPIDSLRETHVMSLDVYLGDVAFALPSPLVDDAQLEQIQGVQGLRPRQVAICFEAARGVAGGYAALERVRREAGAAEGDGFGCVLLSDRGLDSGHAPLPALLAIAIAWKGMVEAGAYRLPLLIETAQVWDTHHVAMSVAAGASAVNPYFAWQLAALSDARGAENFRVAVEAGLRKVLSKMGISTVASYRNSHLFETVGLDTTVTDEFFESASTHLSGKSLDGLLADAVTRHELAYATKPALLAQETEGRGLEAKPEVSTAQLTALTSGLRDAGLYRYRHGGEEHSTSPDLVRRFHAFVREPSVEKYRDYTNYLKQRREVNVRDLIELKPAAALCDQEVEPKALILSRFSTQAMSLGAISKEAHRVLAIAMNRMGARSNTGEGGEDAEIYVSDPGANNKVKQVASARFGVTANYLVHAEELEIKIAQGAKPGEGGQLPPGKVSAYIARLRHAAPGMALISPPPHHDIYSIEDLAQLIHDLKAINPEARIGVKLVAGAGVGIIAAGVAKAGADVITIAGHDGGTGASPLTSIKNTGLPWEIGLRDAHTTLVRCGFRARVRLRVDGGFKSGRDVVIAALLGADEFGFGTSALLAVGCVMARQCHLNTCPVGIATQDERLRQKFVGTPEMVVAYFEHVAEEVREMLSELGACSLDEVIGRVDLLRPRDSEAAAALGDLLDPMPRAQTSLRCIFAERPTLQQRLVELLDRAEKTGHVRSALPICNGDRSVGARLSGDVVRRFGAGQIAPRTFEHEFKGYAGQSFGAFLAHGIRFVLRGEANDYVAKGLSGGEIIVTAGAEASRRGDVLVGNTCLYGATAGQFYVAGRAGERFAVRNSGALAVVEGAGQHACEYMTDGLVAVLGPTGANFGAGMTGGVAYILRDSLPQFSFRDDYVQVQAISDWEEEQLRALLETHFQLTGSYRADRLLSAAGKLAMARVQPLNLPRTVEEIWQTVRPVEVHRLEIDEDEPIDEASAATV